MSRVSGPGGLAGPIESKRPQGGTQTGAEGSPSASAVVPTTAAGRSLQALFDRPDAVSAAAVAAGVDDNADNKLSVKELVAFLRLLEGQGGNGADSSAAAAGKA
jgi:hypothetical protein